MKYTYEELARMIDHSLLHPTMTDAELDYVVRAISEIAEKGSSWAGAYRFDRAHGEFTRNDGRDFRPVDPGKLFEREGLV